MYKEREASDGKCQVQIYQFLYFCMQNFPTLGEARTTLSLSLSLSLSAMADLDLCLDRSLLAVECRGIGILYICPRYSRRRGLPQTAYY